MSDGLELSGMGKMGPRDDARPKRRVGLKSSWTDAAIAGRFALAALLGFAVGLEREFRGKAAGLRTFALIALGSAALTGIGIAHFPESGDRVIQGIVAGIGFLGAGIIFQREEGVVEGLTTAASVWAVAAIGVLAGASAYISALVGTLLCLLILELDRIPVLRRVKQPGRQEIG
jgi:putative Mg2+ transporter-C (MgtC) family protein